MARPQLCLLSALVMLVQVDTAANLVCCSPASIPYSYRSQAVESPLESPKTVANINVSDADRRVAVYPEATHPLEQDLRQITGESDWVRMHSMFDQSKCGDSLKMHKLLTLCKSMMVSLLQADLPETDRLQERLAFHCNYHACSESLWPHHQQWGSVSNRGLRGMPIFPRPLQWWPELEAAISKLEQAIPQLTEEHFERRSRGTSNEKYLILKGKWTGVQLIRPNRHQLECSPKYPVTCKAIEEFAAALPRCSGGCLHLPAPYFEPYQIAQGSYNVMDPGTKLKKHTSSDNQRIKLHCGIANPSNVSMRIGNQTLTWEPGVCHLIDDSWEHSVVSNEDGQVRVILELKIVHPDFATSSHVYDIVGYKASTNTPPTMVEITRLPQQHDEM